MKDIKILVYLQEDRLSFKGGPFAVGYCYHQEMHRRGDNKLKFLKGSPKQPVDKTEGKQPSNNALLQSIITAVRIFLFYMWKFFKAKPLCNIFDEFDIVHFHSTLDLYRERKNLRNFKGKVILQSHSPMPLGQEIYEDLSYKFKLFIPLFKFNLRKMDKYAFFRADYIIFPCKEAEEPYFKRFKGYNKIHENRKDAYRYVLTGIPGVKAKRDKEVVRKELGVKKNDFLISYVGRHNEAKGYDILKSIAVSFLEKHTSSYFVITGKESPLTRLDHIRWKEIGWTDDAKSYIYASDVFVLPNRETYFDIVMLEVLSLGKIVVASRTGGNRFFERENCQGVFLYNTPEECIIILDRISKLTESEREDLGDKNFEFYSKHLTASSMYDKYFDMLSNLNLQ